MGVIHTYNVNFILKLFTNHLHLCFLYFEIIYNQSTCIMAKSAKCNFLFQLDIHVCFSFAQGAAKNGHVIVFL